STTASPSSPNHAIQRSMTAEDGSSGVSPPWNISTNLAISASLVHTYTLVDPTDSRNPLLGALRLAGHGPSSSSTRRGGGAPVRNASSMMAATSSQSTV